MWSFRMTTKRRGRSYPQTKISHPPQEPTMEPTQFLSIQEFQRRSAGRPGPDEIDAFYASHGLGFFVAISHWRAWIDTLWQRLRTSQDHTADIAPIAHRG
jgi:hypothetical protein